MRRTGNKSVSPAIGIVVAGTGKIGFGPDCAWAGIVCVAAPASASAVDARMVRRSTVFMGIFPVLVLFDRLSSPAFGAGQDSACVNEKGPRERRPLELTQDDRSPF